MADYEAYSLNMALRWAAKSTSPWAGETWQTHLRMIVSGPDGHPLDAGRIEPDVFGVSDSSTARTSDVWDISQGWAGRTVLGGVVVTDDDIDDILAAVKAFLVTTKTWLGNVYEFESVRLYPMLLGGGTPFKAGVSATAPTIATPNSTTVDPASTSTAAPDMSIAVSLATGTRGPSGRGRMFLGGISSSAIATDGLVLSTPSILFGGAVETLLESIRAIDQGGIGPARFTPVIYTSRPNKSGANADTGSVINKVRMGDEWDTQRRRDRQRVENYTDYALED